MGSRTSVAQTNPVAVADRVASGHGSPTSTTAVLHFVLDSVQGDVL